MSTKHRTSGNLFLLQSKVQQSNVGGKPKDHLYKILVIGDLGTGKTSIIKRYVHQFFSQHYRATIGVDFALKVLTWDDMTLIRLQLWDIAGYFETVKPITAIPDDENAISSRSGEIRKYDEGVLQRSSWSFYSIRCD